MSTCDFGHRCVEKSDILKITRPGRVMTRNGEKCESVEGYEECGEYKGGVEYRFFFELNTYKVDN